MPGPKHRWPSRAPRSIAKALVGASALTVSVVAISTVTLASNDLQAVPRPGPGVSTVETVDPSAVAPEIAVVPSTVDRFSFEVPIGVNANPFTPLAVRSSSVPSSALAAYQRAESILDAANPDCHVPWSLLAAVGAVVSDHGRDGTSSGPVDEQEATAIVGPWLFDSAGVRVSDTDGGHLDEDPSFDRPVGPMYLAPTLWAIVGVDADSDGQRNPQDLDDSALATAVLLCSGGADLSVPSQRRTALAGLNTNERFVDLVVENEARLRHDTAIPLPPGVYPVGDIDGSLSEPLEPARSPTPHGRAARREASRWVAHKREHWTTPSWTAPPWATPDPWSSEPPLAGPTTPTEGCPSNPRGPAPWPKPSPSVARSPTPAPTPSATPTAAASGQASVQASTVPTPSASVPSGGDDAAIPQPSPSGAQICPSPWATP